MAKSAKKAKKTEKASIPRPLNCFLFYRLEKQKEILAQCPGANHRDISKIIAKWWKDATEEEKEPFREQARIVKEEHYRMHPTYKYQPKKRNVPKRPYRHRGQHDAFASPSAENNKFMETIYDHIQSSVLMPTKDGASKTEENLHHSVYLREDTPHLFNSPSTLGDYHVSFELGSPSTLNTPMSFEVCNSFDSIPLSSADYILFNSVYTENSSTVSVDLEDTNLIEQQSFISSYIAQDTENCFLPASSMLFNTLNMQDSFTQPMSCSDSENVNIAGQYMNEIFINTSFMQT
ncbi:hypothetical protein G6F57_009618 [Rhizopus arrhizus]|nr:hypothetical protein G6F30_007955 [Rhizopus arrhizus]KAG0977800.1 hypothetical protein G6F29_009792 [Rhizopus arrhizus]KAG1336787.1 hypothetical protein G6F63_009354 [Rhizopus arrhizus]KAG1374557.1 hypothetical protein G6F61_009226 [Rhizopus arrhizus]KAG1415819.1 hypothetical protein G6F59_009574 [Rhizopus arrhizus]